MRPNEGRRLKILLLCDDLRGHANAIKDHISAFRRLSRHDVRTFNPIGMRDSVALDLDEFDVVVIHYSIVLSHQRYVSDAFREKLRRYQGLKVQFIQDEYRWVDQITAAMRDVGIDVLFTLVDEPSASIIYDTRLPGVRRVHTLTGYVPDELASRPWRPLAERTIEVGYRGRDIPYWIGRLSREKVEVGWRFLERAPRYGLKVDIAWSEHDRIYGEQWIDFISSCRATLCSESGASITDFDGSAERAVINYMRIHPEAGFEEVHHAVLEPYEGNAPMPVVSPRVFEAAALGTALIMFPGHYSGVVQPDEHYIVLEKDFSNMDEVVRQLRDDGLIAAMVERAADHLVQSGRWGFKALIERFDQVVEEEAKGQHPRRVGHGYRLARIERPLRVPAPRVRVVRAALDVVSAVRGRDFARRKEIESGVLLVKAAVAFRAALGDSTLRPIFQEGRRQGFSRAGLLDELLDFSLLVRAARGSLESREKFTVVSAFVRSQSLLRFTSEPVHGQGVPEQSADSREALLHGSLERIEWNHMALGGTVTLARPKIMIGIGREGLKQFDLLVQIGKRRPELLRRALRPVLESGMTEKATVA